MSPIDPRELDSSPRQQALRCIQCGYDLEGLARTGVCPECGLLIKDSIRRRGHAALEDVDRAYLERLQLGFILMVLGSGLGVFFGVVSLPIEPKLSVYFLGGGSILWAIGVYLSVGAPLPGTVIDPFRNVRWLTIGTQLCWPIGFALGATPWSGAGIVASMFMLVGLAGLTPLCFILSDLAYTAKDTDMSHRVRIVGIVLIFGTLMAALGVGAGFAGSPAFIALAVFLALPSLTVPLLILYFYLLRFDSLLRWSIRLRGRAAAAPITAREFATPTERPPSLQEIQDVDSVSDSDAPSSRGFVLERRADAAGEYELAPEE